MPKTKKAGGSGPVVAMNLTPGEQDFLRSEDNRRRIQEISSSWPAGSHENLVRDGRLFVREGPLLKMCRKGLKTRHFFLFNDILVYGSVLTKGSYKGQTVLPLAEMMVQDVEDSAEGSNGFQINHEEKSFVVYSGSVQDKASWMASLNRFIKLNQEATGKEAVARAVWIPDKKVKTCMVCNTTTFTLTQRRHHCRNCGKVVCGACSSSKAILNKDKPERVCSNCHRKLGATSAQDVPVLGKASSETEKKTKPMSRRNSEVSDISDSDLSSSDDSSSDDDDDLEVAEGSSAAMFAGAGGGNKANLTASEKKMHQLSDEDRINLMMLVKDGQLSMDEALKQIEKGKGRAASSSVPPSPSRANAANTPSGPHAVALYENDDPEHPDELVFHEGDTIILTRKVNDEWLEGHLVGKPDTSKGIFPAAFVEVKIPIA